MSRQADIDDAVTLLLEAMEVGVFDKIWAELPANIKQAVYQYADARTQLPLNVTYLVTTVVKTYLTRIKENAQGG